MNILPNINGHDDLLRLSDMERETLCAEIRAFLVEHIAKTGGHLASNLGVVELSVAIETVFDTAKDRLVFDVGHQSYIHKILTGRQADFDRLRQFGGIAGFPKPSESQTDSFTAGHASSSVSIALGMARARTLQKLDYQVVTLLGDGAATGGMVYEGLNDAAVSGEPMIVILNDNAMSIDRNVGGMATHLSRLRSKQQYLNMKKRYRTTLQKIPGGKQIYRFTRSIKDWLKRALIPTTIFENMGFTYLGPVDGHDLPNLIALLRTAKEMKRPVLLHVITRKGHGYAPAEQNPSLFHGIGKFDPVSGTPAMKRQPTFSDAFGGALVELAARNEKVCAITAAMPGGTGLLKFKERYPSRLFDVGIAEEHAVSMAGGLAKQGMIPVVAIYSTFLQRSYDMILQDVAMQNLHVVFAIDRAGLVGEDGETHHGVFDLGFLRQIPNMTVLTPASLHELRDMLRWAIEEHNGPVAIRYPRGGDRGFALSDWDGKASVKQHRAGNDVTLVTYGTMINNVLGAAKVLQEQGIEATVLRLMRIDEFDISEIVNHLSDRHHVVVLEEVSGGTGIREALAWAIRSFLPDCRVDGLDLGKAFVTHGSLNALYAHYGLDEASIANYVQEVLKVED